MKALSLKVKEDIFEDAEKMVKELHISRNAYLNQAIELYNKYNRRRLLKKRLAKESRMVRQTSMEVLAEMEQLDDPIDDYKEI